MNGFKLLAIIPLDDCDKKFTKNLKRGEIYQFYQDYEIKLNVENTNVASAKVKASATYDKLFNLENGIKVNTSAVVGTNGSGKSTLIELLYYFVYASCTNLITEKTGKTILNKNSADLEYQRRVVGRDYKKLEKTNSVILASKFQVKHHLKIEDYEKITDSGYLKLILKLLEQKSILLTKKKEDARNLERKITNNLNVAIVFENDNGVFSARYFKSELSITCLNKYVDTLSSDTFTLQDFFYSISLNFSHHSLNAKTLGGWINNLFHKNDAYTTPVVINPMRENGNFNINTELHLSNERLMSNLAYDIAQKKDYKLLDKYKVTKFIFRSKTSISPIRNSEANNQAERNRNLSPLLMSFTKDDFEKLASVNLLKKFIQIDHFSDYSPFLDYALGYLEAKIPKIKEQYEQLFTSKDGIINNNKFEDFLVKDQSHITKKVRQTINFIKSTYRLADSPWHNPTSYLSNHITINEFKKWLEICDSNYTNLSPGQLMEFAHPGFFNIDFELKTETNQKVLLSELSSGEQQMILNINSITYHLYNLQSVHKQNLNDGRIKYNHVSVILDEIELYYHPEMQRQLVTNILKSFELIKKKGEAGIESINLSFLTHSPFILSDIPSSNVLKLRLNKNNESTPISQNSNSFGANIHELLSDSFFMDATSGQFAIEQINKLISLYDDVRSTLTTKQTVTENSFDQLASTFSENENLFIFLEENIGEVVIRTLIKNHTAFIREQLKNHLKNDSK